MPIFWEKTAKDQLKEVAKDIEKKLEKLEKEAKEAKRKNDK